MAELQDLVDKRDFHACEADKIHNAAEADNKGEGREFTDDESKDFDDHMEKAEAYDRRIDIAKKVEQHGKGKRLTTPPPLSNPNTIETAERKVPAVPRVHRNLRSFKGEHAHETAHACGQWLLAGVFQEADLDGKRRQWCIDHGMEFRVQTEAINTAGGYLVPEEFENTIINLKEVRGIARQHCKITAMASDTKVQPRRTSGVTAYAIGETDSITASDMAWDQIRLTANKWGVLIRMSTDINEDSLVNLADELAQDIAYAFADKEDESLFNGDGTSTYHGVFGATEKSVDGNHTAGLVQAASGNDQWGNLDLVDFESVCATLPTYAEGNAKWFINKVGYWHSMARLMDAAGGNAVQDLGSGPVRQFLGYPVIYTMVLPAGTSSADLDADVIAIFGDMSQGATLGDRRGMTLKQDASRYLEFDQVAIQATTRFDINVHGLGDTTNAGPLIAFRANT